MNEISVRPEAPSDHSAIRDLIVAVFTETYGSGGSEAVFVTGALKYYSRFGFVPISSTRLHTIFESEHDMVLELETGLLARVSGLVQYPPPWHAFL